MFVLEWAVMTTKLSLSLLTQQFLMFLKQDSNLDSCLSIKISLFVMHLKDKLVIF